MSKNKLPNYSQIRTALQQIIAEGNGGLGFHMWAVVVDRDGVVQSVVMSGEHRGDQWPGSRVIAAQKANTANAYSLPNFALSTANLFTATQPGQSLFGLAFSNPVDPDVAYQGKPKRFGTKKDPMMGYCIGGVNVFGGGVPLYNSEGELVGGLGVSGDTSGADHNIAWKLRHALELDYVPAGVHPTQGDNIIYDIENGVSKSGWGHPETSAETTAMAQAFDETHPIREVSVEVEADEELLAEA